MLNCSQVLQRPAMTHAPPADVLVSSPLLPHLMTGVPSMTRRRHVQILVHIAKKLEALHAAGWVHRDLKPGNTIWLPSQNKWSLIDFGCACLVDQQAPLSFSLYYAPPEVLAAYKAGATTVRSQPAADVWALGVRALACSSCDHNAPRLRAPEACLFATRTPAVQQSLGLRAWQVV